MIAPRVFAHAVVDVGRFPCSVDHTPFVVTVFGQLEGGDGLPTKHYRIAAVDDDTAARAGLDLYVSEMSRVN